MNFIAVLLLTYIQDEEDAFWSLVFVMFEKGWRDIFNQKSSKIASVLNDLEIYIKQTWPKLHQRLLSDEYLSMESTFTSQVITLYIYDAPLDIATRIFELFLLDGAQIVVDLIAGLIDIQYSKIMHLEELELMTYLRKDIITDVFSSFTFKQVLKGSPNVKLSE